jgi:3-hydroxyisobutyrate dehydrogenase
MAEQVGDQRVAVIGLGSMGFGMATSLVDAGFHVTGFDVRPEVVARFVAAGGHGAESTASAVTEATIIVVVVVNADQTEGALFGSQGVVAAAQPGSVIISCATMAPERARAFATRANEAGLLYLDAPISGGAQRAAQGELTILASGSRDAFAAAQPALDALSATLHDLGDEPGKGAAYKIVNQLLAGVHIAVACEAITFAKRLDLDLAKVYEVITGSAGNSWMFENRIPHVPEGDYAPRSAVEIFTKDLGIIADISRSERFATPMAASALQLFLMTASAGMGRDDDASVARLYAQIAGLDLPTGKADA